MKTQKFQCGFPQFQKADQRTGHLILSTLRKLSRNIILEKKNREGWEIRTKEKERFLVLEKGNLDLTIQIREEKNGKSDIVYTLEERAR